MDERIKQIANYYGYGKQKIQLMEELGELMQAISKYDRAEYGFEIYNAFWNIVDELVDVQVMIDQLRELLHVSPECFEGKYNAKLNRQIKRIEDEKLVYVIDAVHEVGGKEYSWRVPENKQLPKVGQIVYVNAQGDVKPVILKRIRRMARKDAKKLKTMVGDRLEQQE
jgi:NTP pyrophosphatase (non-canonical NTP hydrolase)